MPAILYSIKSIRGAVANSPLANGLSDQYIVCGGTNQDKTWPTICMLKLPIPRLYKFCCPKGADYAYAH